MQKVGILKYVWFIIAIMSLAGGVGAEPVLVEAESLEQKGGWVVDQQFMDVMGSPYLLAHGLGRPVANATGRYTLANGRYRLWVRTKDWAAPRGPGRFQIAVGGETLPMIFGVSTNTDWFWIDGGSVAVTNGPVVSVSMIDLTGFEARCDALLFVPEAEATGYLPPAHPDFAWRRRLLGRDPDAPDRAAHYDLVVVGGGYAGICMAVEAARRGVKTALVQDRPVLGGNASGEVRVGPIGILDLPPYPRNSDLLYEIYQVSHQGDAVAGLRPAPDDHAVERWARTETNLTLYLNEHVSEALVVSNRIVAVLSRNICDSSVTRLEATLFADCTGDANLGALAGAALRERPEDFSETGEPHAARGRKYFMGATDFWTTRWTAADTPFPACPWALPVTAESFAVSDPLSKPTGKAPFTTCWNWESGFEQDQVKDAESIRDHNFRAAYGTWDYLKNRATNRADYAKAEMSWMAYILGKRESRRLMGDLILKEQDLVSGTAYPDGIVTTTWFIDLHFPHPENSRFFPGREYRSVAYDDPNWTNLNVKVPGVYTKIQPYAIPYRCFYSTNIANLFMAGRDISVTHVALSSVRVMNTTAQMGTALGRAAALCHAFNCLPRELYESHLADLKALLSNPGSRSARSGAGWRRMARRDTAAREVWYWVRFVLRPVKHHPFCAAGVTVLVLGGAFLVFRKRRAA